MKIEAGKYYMTRDGRKAKVMYDDGTDNDPIKVDHGDRRELWHRRDGTCNIGEKDDLITEWQETQDLAALAAQHRICITERVGSIEIIYDGRG